MKDVIINFYLNNSFVINITIISLFIIALTLFLIFKDKISALYHKNKEIINYIIVGALTTFVSVLSYWLFRFIIKDYIILSILSWICAVTFAYITNRLFVFESKSNNIVGEVTKFVSCRLLTLILEITLMALFVSILHINDMISKIVLQFVVLALNYILSKLIVFKKK